MKFGTQHFSELDVEIHLKQLVIYHTYAKGFDINIYLKTSILTEKVILSQSLVASIFPIRTVKPVLSCNITNNKN